MKQKNLILVGLILVILNTSILSLNNNFISVTIENDSVLCENKSMPLEDITIVYDGMTMNQLAEKLDKSLSSTVSGQGYIFAKYSIEMGVDPYLAVAIMLHETGCKWTCSSLARVCNNYGGQKGTPSCNGGSYRSYETQEEGIKGFISNLARNYISKGLTTPEQINKRYAEDQSWSIKINRYIKEIKSK